MDEVGDHYRKGKPRTVVHAGRAGKNLDDVLRDILLDLKTQNAWTQEDLAARLGMAQNTLSRKLGAVVLKEGGAEQAFTVAELTAICNAIDHSPMQLLALHPEYADESREARVFPKDHLFRRYNTLLRNADARGLLHSLEDAERLGVLDDAIEDVRRTVEKARKALDRSAKKRRNSLPARRKRRTG